MARHRCLLDMLPSNSIDMSLITYRQHQTDVDEGGIRLLLNDGIISQCTA